MNNENKNKRPNWLITFYAFHLGILAYSMLLDTYVNVRSANSEDSNTVEYISEELNILYSETDYSDILYKEYKDGETVRDSIDNAFLKAKGKQFGILQHPKSSPYRVPIVSPTGSYSLTVDSYADWLTCSNFGAISEESHLALKAVLTDLEYLDIYLILRDSDTVDYLISDKELTFDESKSGWDIYTSTEGDLYLIQYLDNDYCVVVSALNTQFTSKRLSKDNLSSFAHCLAQAISVEPSEHVLLSTKVDVPYLKIKTDTQYKFTPFDDAYVKSWQVIDEDVKTNKGEYNQLEIFYTVTGYTYTIKEYWDKTLLSYTSERSSSDSVSFTTSKYWDIPIQVGVDEDGNFVEVVTEFNDEVFVFTYDGEASPGDYVYQIANEILDAVGTYLW